MNPRSLMGVDTQPKPVLARKDYTLEKEAQNDWRALCSGSEDAETGLRRYIANSGGVRPEAFDNGGRYKTRRGFEFLRGKRRNGAYAGGPLGRARVMAGQPLELRRIPFSAIPELSALESNLSAQFEPRLVKLATDMLKAHIVGPAFGCIENGRVSKRNHFHVFVTPGTCELGVSNGVVLDEHLPRRAAYLGKGPHWNFETALAYLKAKQGLLGKRVADRYFHFNLGNQRKWPITLAMIEETLGCSLVKPEAIEKPAPLPTLPPIEERAQALAVLPTLSGATLQELEQVANLHGAWIEGRCNGVLLKLPGRTSPDLGRTLKAYFERTRLSPGEVADLVDFAKAFGESIDVSLPAMRAVEDTGHVKPYRFSSGKKPYQTGHVRLA